MSNAKSTKIKMEFNRNTMKPTPLAELGNIKEQLKKARIFSASILKKQATLSIAHKNLTVVFASNVQHARTGDKIEAIEQDMQILNEIVQKTYEDAVNFEETLIKLENMANEEMDAVRYSKKFKS